MTFDAWWNNHGSLHPTIFALAFEQRENYRLVAETAWKYLEQELESENETKCDNHINQLDMQQEKAIV